jgi:translation initiation factor IF-2
MRCATMLERAPELAVILCFDVAVDKDAERQAEDALPVRQELIEQVVDNVGCWNHVVSKEADEK